MDTHGTSEPGSSLAPRRQPGITVGLDWSDTSWGQEHLNDASHAQDGTTPGDKKCQAGCHVPTAEPPGAEVQLLLAAPADEDTSLSGAPCGPVDPLNFFGPLDSFDPFDPLESLEPHDPFEPSVPLDPGTASGLGNQDDWLNELWSQLDCNGNQPTVLAPLASAFKRVSDTAPACAIDGDPGARQIAQQCTEGATNVGPACTVDTVPGNRHSAQQLVEGAATVGPVCAVARDPGDVQRAQRQRTEGVPGAGPACAVDREPVDGQSAQERMEGAMPNGPGGGLEPSNLPTVAAPERGWGQHRVDPKACQASPARAAMPAWPHACAVAELQAGAPAPGRGRAWRSDGIDSRGVAEGRCTHPGGAGAEKVDGPLLPPKVIGLVPESHFLTLFNVLHEKGVTLGMDRLAHQAGPGAGPLCNAKPADVGARLAGVQDTGAVDHQEDCIPCLEPRRNGQKDEGYAVAGLPPAVARKVFGFVEEEDAARSAAPGVSHSMQSAVMIGSDRASLSNRQTPAGKLLSNGGPRSRAEQPVKEWSSLSEDRSNEPRVVDDSLRVPRASEGGNSAKPLSTRLASMLTQIQTKGDSSCRQSWSRPLGMGSPQTTSQSGHTLLVTHSSTIPLRNEFLQHLAHPHQDHLLLARRKRTHLDASSINLEADWYTNEPNDRLNLRSLLPKRQVLEAATASQPNIAGSPSALVLHRGPSPVLNHNLEREYFLRQLTELAEALERNDMDQFAGLYQRLRVHSKPNGTARERSIHHALRSLICRKDGTGEKHLSKRGRTSVQELDNARKWFFTANPNFICSTLLCSGLALPKLKGRRNIHIVAIGPVMQWPMFLRLLAQDGTPQTRLKRVRLTIVNAWSLVLPQRTDLITMRSLGLAGMTIGEAAASLGLEYSFRIVDIVDDSLDWMEAIERRDDEALAVCSCGEVCCLHDDPTFSGGLRLRLFQALKDLRADVFTLVEKDIPDGSSPFLVPRFQSCFRYQWAFFHFDDILGIGNHKYAQCMEGLAVADDMVRAISAEGRSRRWRPQSSSQWQASLLQWGFRPLQVDATAQSIITGILQSYPKCFQMVYDEPWLKLTFEETVLVIASAWTT